MYKLFLILIICLHGSKNYSQQSFHLPLKKYKVTDLESSLFEASGIINHNGKFFVINDGENNREIFLIDKNGRQLRKYNVEQKNNDWEAITIKQDTLFVGDIGNNFGKREKLEIHKYLINHDSLSYINSISFKFPQTQTTKIKGMHHDFDAEAIFNYKENLYIVTKERESKGASIFKVNDNLIKVDFYNSKFLVTDACFYNQKLYLLGYTKKGFCKVLIFDASEKSDKFFNKLIAKIKLGHILKLGLTEGISVNEEGIYIVSEGLKHKFSSVNPGFYFIPKELLN